MGLDMLERVHLARHHLDRYPVELTASEQQRVGIARDLIRRLGAEPNQIAPSKRVLKIIL